MKKADVIIIISVVLIGLLGAAYGLFKDNVVGGIAHIYIDGDLYESLSLEIDQETTVTTDLGFNTVVVKDGEAYISRADCKDQLCTRMNPINQEGAFIVCLPHHVHIEIESHEEVEIDAISN